MCGNYYPTEAPTMIMIIKMIMIMIIICLKLEVNS